MTTTKLPFVGWLKFLNWIELLCIMVWPLHLTGCWIWIFYSLILFYQFLCNGEAILHQYYVIISCMCACMCMVYKCMLWVLRVGVMCANNIVLLSLRCQIIAKGESPSYTTHTLMHACMSTRTHAHTHSNQKQNNKQIMIPQLKHSRIIIHNTFITSEKFSLCC